VSVDSDCLQECCSRECWHCWQYTGYTEHTRRWPAGSFVPLSKCGQVW